MGSSLGDQSPARQVACKSVDNRADWAAQPVDSHRPFGFVPPWGQETERGMRWLGVGGVGAGLLLG